jgi:hypothetical protein
MTCRAWCLVVSCYSLDCESLTSGGLISAAFIENVREPGSRQRGVDPALVP